MTAGWLVALALMGCASAPATAETPAAPQTAPEVTLPHTEHLVVQARALERSYHLYVALPDGYARHPDRKWPVLFLTDAPYAFPLVRSVVNRMSDSRRMRRTPIIVGLGYAVGDSRTHSRRRDYTPTPHGDVDARPERAGKKVVYGKAEQYRQHLAKDVLPLIASRYRADTNDFTYAGHSYGGLLGAHILLTAPEMFQRYILLSPSLWYGRKVIPARERARAITAKDLPASVFMAIGAQETTEHPDTEPRHNSSYDMVGDMQQFANQLSARPYPNLDITTLEIPGEDHLTVYPAAITRALEWAYGENLK